MMCLWSSCDQIKRQKWSLVNHLQERHCNENALKTALSARQRGLNQPGVINTHIPNINLSKDAALFAIQRHQTKRKEDFMVSNLHLMKECIFLFLTM